MAGTPKWAREEIRISRAPAEMAGVTRGIVILRITVPCVAPAIRADSSRVGSIRSRADTTCIQGGSFQAKGVHQPGVNVAAASGQQHVPGHGPEEWGEHVRDHKQGPHEAFAGNVAAAQQPGVEQADDGAEDGYGKADDDGIGHGIHVIFAEYYCLEHFDVELSFKEEGVVDDHKDWNKYDDEQQHKADHGHGFIQPESGAVKSR